jgi:aryl-alcohol dehydrogenase
MIHATAAVARGRDGTMSLEEIVIEAPRPTEVVVRMASAGVCRTDLHALAHMDLPIVLGHEGAGHVEAVGSSVTKVAVGDPVLMTFLSCGACPRCLRADVAYCAHFNELNFTGRRPDGSSAISVNGEVVGGHFLGQSCFATHALVDQRSVVRLPAGTDLHPLGPFGCGFQTGAGAVLNALRPPVGSSLAVLGAGAVGLAAVVAADMAGCDPIVAVDLDQRRLELAGCLGATHVVDSGSTDVDEALRGAVPGGLDFVLDTTGLSALVSGAVSCLNTRGTCGIIGAGPSQELTLDWRTLLNGRTVTGIIAGNSIPELFLPRLVELYQAGSFTVDGLIEYFPFSDVNRALMLSAQGESIKPVLTFDAP